jgi:hypothetical protein
MAPSNTPPSRNDSISGQHAQKTLLLLLLILLHLLIS